MYKAKVISKDEIKKKIKEAIHKFDETSYRMPDKIIVSEIKLPKIIHNGKVLDLNKKYKNATFVGTVLGSVIAIPYVARKGDKKNKLGFIHFVETPVYLVFDPDDTRRIYFAFGELKVKDVGIVGEEV